MGHIRPFLPFAGREESARAVTRRRRGERVKSTQTGVIDGLGSGIPVLWLGSLYVDLMARPLQAAGRMFWFTWKRFAGSYFFFRLASRS